MLKGDMYSTNDKRAIVFGSYIFSLINFRKNLLEDLKARHYTVIAIAPDYDEEVVNQLKQIGIQFYSITLSRTGFNPFVDIISIVECFRIIRRFKPTLLITYTIKPVIYGSLVASFFSKVKAVALITGLGYLETGEKTTRKVLMNKLVFELYRIALRRLHFIAYQNPDDKRYFNENKLLRNKMTKEIIISGSGVDMNYYRREKSVLKPVVFLFIARLIKAKGILQYWKAAIHLKKLYGDSVIFKVIGLPDDNNPDSLQDGDLKEMINDKAIEYLGHQKDVRPFIAASSVFVLPSFYREGTPRTILESMSMGRSIITTDSTGCRETVRHGVNGYLVPVKDVQSLITAMEIFIKNPKLIETMGEAAYLMTVEKYDVTKVNKELFSFIDV